MFSPIIFLFFADVVTLLHDWFIKGGSVTAFDAVTDFNEFDHFLILFMLSPFDGFYFSIMLVIYHKSDLSMVVLLLDNFDSVTGSIV